MNQRKPRSKKSSDSVAAEKGSGKEVIRSAQDRPDDPLFVPHIEALGISADHLSAGRDEYAALLEDICGAKDDSQPVEQYDGTLGVTTAFVAARQSAACQAQWNSNLASIYTNPGNVSGVRWGSGTMIADDLFLTCGHLFDQTGGGWERPRQNGTTNIILPQEIARNMHLNFNYQLDPAGNLRTEQSFAIVELLEYRLGGLDMALCRIAGSPGATFGRAAVSTTDAAVPDTICIIGHPAGQPKRIEAGPTTAIDGNLIRYNDIDTLGGNSGSGVLRASDGQLVGIHTNGGCTPASPAGSGSNFGQRIAAVIAVSPTLQRLTQPKLPVVDTAPRLDIGVTLRAADQIGTTPSADTNPRIDIMATIPRADTPIKRKFFDDVKTPALDKAPAADTKFPSNDGIFDPKGPSDSINPVGPIAGRFNRPFVLANPHHASNWASTGSGEGTAAELETALRQLEAAIEQGEAHLDQLAAQYRQLLTEYQSLGGGQT